MYAKDKLKKKGKVGVTPLMYTVEAAAFATAYDICYLTQWW